MHSSNPFDDISRQSCWDAIVIGAGPAGAIAARQLALQGKSVLLVDKSKLPREKVCGGCLGGAALEGLASVGLGGLALACGGVPLTTFALACGGDVARLPVGSRLAISRQTFDNALVHQAVRVGVAVCDEVRGTVLRSHGEQSRHVVLRHRGREITAQAKVAIVATGLAPSPEWCDTHVSRRSYIGLGAVVEEPPIDASVGTLQMACGSHGYVGITAVDRGAFDIAAAVDPRALTGSASPGQMVHDILVQSGLSPNIDMTALRWRGTPLLTRRTQPLGSHRCLLIGDAAGYVEPFTGEGIGWAIHSALMATALLAEPLDVWDSQLTARWQQAYDKGLAAKHRACGALSSALRSSAVRRIVAASLRRAPSLGRPIVAWLDRSLMTPTAK